MQRIPKLSMPIHFVGIGGIGMSGIAELLHLSGYKVTGSDPAQNANVKRLQEMGIEIFPVQTEDNVIGKAAIVYSSAVKSDNPEMKEARKRRIPVVRRAEILAEIMRSYSCIAIGGSHGKTTTTTLMATLLEQAKFDPTVVNGGIINAYKSNTKLGKSKWMVAEADESDGTFLKLPAQFAIITNADPEHLDHYGTYENMIEAFVNFASNVPFYGAAVLCSDHPQVRQIAGRLQDKPFITYGFNAQADIRAISLHTDVSGSHFDIEVNRTGDTEKTIIKDVFLPATGEHNVLNSLATVCVALELGISYEDIRGGLASFAGVKRRFTLTGSYNDIRIIDDYAHHPIEIMATLKAARQSVGETGKILAVIQPHRYSRLSNLFEDFSTCLNDADMVYITDIYSAGEQPIENITPERYVESVIAHGHKDAHYLTSFDNLPEIIKSRCSAGDIVLMMGAGSITNIAQDLPKKLTEQKNVA